MKNTNNNTDSFFSEVMTEPELIQFLRISEVTKATDTHNVVANLRRMHNLPTIHICKQPLYWKPAIRQWIADKVARENGK
jgi:hypothetical protein